ncbi:hypothetical protein RI367_006935 [Sorochytrium milnesiophthora]
MKGLSVFIADIRNCRSREAEEKRINKELANIRAKFKDGNMTGYDRKKYVCKLMYMYILGWNVDFGHVEAINLISSSKYSEKQVGYLAVTLLFNENSDLARLIINSMAKDLADHNEVNNCLALHAIANVGSKEMAEILGPEAFRLLTSSSSKSFVRKKAALCLLRLYKKFPDVMLVTEWADKIVDVMGNSDYQGVVISVTSLVAEMCRQYQGEFAACIRRAVDKLHGIVLGHESNPDYVYYKVPLPWLQVKLLRLIQQYPPLAPGDANRQKLEQVIQAIFNNNPEAHKSANHNNAQNAVLFEAINLAMYMDPESPLVAAAANILGKFLSSKEPNLRYLALQSFASLANYVESLDAIKRHQETIFMALKDKDVSVRRQALDLLYSMCDVTNAREVVAELLRQLLVSDEAIKEEMVLKIAILAEKFAPNYTWYLDTILQIIATAGEYTSDDIWHRIVQIVSNQPDLQTYATQTIYRSLRDPSCHESTVKVAAYLLGEYGHYNPDVAPIEMLQALHAHFNYASQSTKALLVTTYFKMVNLFPEIKAQVVSILQSFGSSLDVELQNRACEYLAILNQPTTQMLELLCDEMPPFPMRTSALEDRLAKKREESPNRGDAAARAQRRSPSPSQIGSQGNASPTIVTTSLETQGRGSNNGPMSAMNDLLGLDLVQAPTLAGGVYSDGGGSGGGSIALPLSPPRASSPSNSFTLAPESEAQFAKFYYDNDGVLYEDASLQIGVKSKFQGELGAVSFYIGNKTNVAFNEFRISVQPLPSLQLAVSSTFPGGVVGQGQQVQHIINIQLVNFDLLAPPLVHCTFAPAAPIASATEFTLRLPLLITKFCAPLPVDGATYMGKWNAFGAQLEVKQIIDVPAATPMNVEWCKSVLRQHWNLLEGLDKPENVIACASLKSVQSGGPLEVYMRVQTNAAVRKYCITTRSNNGNVNKAVVDVVANILLGAQA